MNVNEANAVPPAQGRKGSIRVNWLVWVVVVVALAGGGYWILAGDETVIDTNVPTFAVERGNLVISVLEGGNLKALKSQEIKSGVEGSATIISLCPEGTRITEKDIAEGRLLVELDSSDIWERLQSQEITCQSAEADFVLAEEALNIQLKQNDSDRTASELAVKFARLDLRRYLGREIAEELIAVGKKLELADKLIDPDLCGTREENTGRIQGASRQRKRELLNAIALSEEELERAKKDLEWTIKLEAKGFVAENDLVADTIALKRRTVDLEQTKTALDLFLEYEFSKEAEMLLSDFEEAKQQLDRTLARNRAQEAQKKSSLEASRAKRDLQRRRLEEYREQLANCKIKATQPGLVVWTNVDYGRDSRRIEEGGSVRQRQTIISIPDISTMAVEVKVHETSVDRVVPGQPAIVTVEARSEAVFEGEVLKVAVLPDQQSRWLNPDLKVYSTDVSIKGTHEFLKPGMSAQVEIIVKELHDILIVPIQAVVAREGKSYCFLKDNGEARPVPVKTGDYNSTFIQITEGLSEGDLVLVRPTSQDWQMIPLNGNGSKAKRRSWTGAGRVPGATGGSPGGEKGGPTTARPGGDRSGETGRPTPDGMGMPSSEGTRKKAREGMRKRPSGAAGEGTRQGRGRPESGGTGRRSGPSSGSPATEASPKGDGR